MKNALFVLIAAMMGAVGFLLYASLHEETASAATAPTQMVMPVADSKPLVTTIPDVSLPNKEGKKQSLRSWTGKSMIINFWATWCGPCRKEIPLLKEIQKTTAAEGFQVVGVAIDYRDDVLKYAAEIKMDYPILIGEEEGLKAAEAFGVDSGGLPFTVFTDSKQRIVLTLLGELTKTKADIILAHVRRVNKGELTPEAARAAIAGKLQTLKPA